MHTALLDAETRSSAQGEPAQNAAPAAISASGGRYVPPAPRVLESKSLLVVRSPAAASNAHVPSPAPPPPIDAAAVAHAGGIDIRRTRPLPASHVLLSTSASTTHAARYELPGSLGTPTAATVLGRSLTTTRTTTFGDVSGSTPVSRAPALTTYLPSSAERPRSLSSVATVATVRVAVGGGDDGTGGALPSHAAASKLLPPSVALASIAAASEVVPSVRDELRLLWRLGWPVALAIFFRIAMLVTDLAMLGHRNTDWLAAASAAAIWMNISSAFLYRAFGGSLNTLCAQAFGAGSFKLVGLWLQQALVWSTVASMLVGISWWFTGPMLRVMLIDADVAELASTFARWSLLWLLPQVWMDMLNRYFQAQHVLMPALVVNAIFVVVNALLNLLFLFGIPSGWIPSGISATAHRDGWAGLGFKGSPIATAISRWAMLLAYWIYCVPYRKFHKKTWWGWNLSRGVQGALHPARVRAYLVRQCLPSAVGICLEEWQLQVIAIFATKLGTVEIATHNSVLELFFFLGSFLFGLVAAVQIRIGTYLGSGNARAAQQVARLGFRVSVVIGVGIGSLMMLLRHYIGRIYSSDPAIWDESEHIAILVGACYAALSIFYTSMAVLNGQARPVVVAVAYLIGCWVVCLPLAYALAFPAGQGLLGLWYALCVGYAVVTIIVAYHAYFSDWPQCVREALERAEARKQLLEDPAAADTSARGGSARKSRRRHKKKKNNPMHRQPSSVDSLPHDVAVTLAAGGGVGGIDGASETADSINDARTGSTSSAIVDSEWMDGEEDSETDADDAGSASEDSDGSEEEAWNAEELAYKEQQLQAQRSALMSAQSSV